LAPRPRQVCKKKKRLFDLILCLPQSDSCVGKGSPLKQICLPVM
jgi:hypothetical protein